VKKRIYKKITVVLILVTVCFSCKNMSVLAKNEQDAIDNVIAFYGGGKYTWKKKNYFGSNKSGNTFEFELSESPSIESFSKNLDLFTSGIAYRLYSFMGEDGNKYDVFKIGIRVDNQLTEFDYKVETIKEIEPYIVISDLFIAEVKTNRYHDIYNRCEKNDSSYKLITIEDTKEFCTFIDSSLGKVKDNWFMGYRMMEEDEASTNDVIQISSMIEGEINSAPLSIMLKKENKKIVGLQFN